MSTRLRPQVAFVLAWSIVAACGDPPMPGDTEDSGSSAGGSMSTGSEPGHANTGHPFGDHLTPAERKAVLEYLKTI